MTTNSDISYFFKPKSIAVIGASATPGKVGYNVLKNIIDSGYKGKLYPINPKTEKILGHKSFSNILEVPNQIDIVIFVL